MFLYEKLKNCSIQSFKECLFFVFCLFCFLLLSNNTLHVMFYTYICYWNTFQYKCITFHAVKQSHAFFAYFRFVSTSFYFTMLSSCTVISKNSKKVKTKATKKKGQKTFWFWCCVEEGAINLFFPLCWKIIQKSKVDS